jgi:hypothetical protein
MTPDEYRDLLSRIEASFQGTISAAQRAIADAEVNRMDQLRSAETIWRVLNDGPPPTLERGRPRARPAAQNGNAQPSQRRRIRAIIDGLASGVDSAAIRQRYAELYPDDPQPDSSTVMKIIRELVADEWLLLGRRPR